MISVLYPGICRTDDIFTSQTREEGKHDTPTASQVSTAETQAEDDYLVKARAFPIWPHEFPCYRPDVQWFTTEVVRSPASKGFLFVKEMKTGSSTVTGITLRIAQRIAKRTGKKFKICKCRFDHSMAGDLKYYKRDRKKSFLWTVIREPNKRATSQFFHFEVSREKAEPSDRNFQKYLSHPLFSDYYLRSLVTGGYDPLNGNPIPAANRVIKDYDFIGITERMDESLVVLAMILDLELTDILYLSAKGSGGFDDGRYKGTCVYIVPAYVSPTMKTFFSEDETWKNRTTGDHHLYEAAKRSLDMTIDALGRDEVMEKLAQFKSLRKLVESECKDKVIYPCNAGGRRRQKAEGCLWNDSGCGNQCLNNATSAFLNLEL